MSTSIENIWKSGFKKAELTIPRVENLYGRKSIHLIDKIKRTMKWDNLGLIPLSALSITGFYLYDQLLIGIYIAFWIGVIYLINRRRIRQVEKLDFKSSNYEYLVSFRNWIGSTRKYYQKLLAIGVPLIVLPVYYTVFRGKDSFQKFTDQEPAWIIVLSVLFLAGILSLMGLGAYYIAQKMIYGRLCNKLDELIADLRELQKS